MPEASLFLLFVWLFFGFPFVLPVLSQHTNATCLSQFGWMTNSRQQSPCLVEAYLEGACQSDGEWTILALRNTSFGYPGPTSDTANVCSCSSVAFSLAQACAYCQGGQLDTWTNYTANCAAADITNGGYPHAIPPGTAIPAWALQPIDLETGQWDAINAQILLQSGIPDSLAPRATVSSVVSPTVSRTSSIITTTDNTSSASGIPITANQTTTSKAAVHRKFKTGAIIGGAVGGGIGAILLTVIAVSVRRRRLSKRLMKAPSRQILLYPSSPGYDRKFAADLTPPPSGNSLLNPHFPVQIYDPFRASSRVHLTNLTHTTKDNEAVTVSQTTYSVAEV